MSKRDHDLLDAAGLSIAETADVFGRTKQAIYSGLSREKAYFSAQDALVLLHHAKRSDSMKIESLMAFIDAHFSEPESKVVLPDLVGYEQISQVIRDADDVMIAFNGNTDNLSPTSAFAKVITNLVADGGSFLFMAPGEWVAGCIAEKLGLNISTPAISDEIAHLPSFVVTRKNGSFRAFLFLRLSVEEMHSSEAARLWMYFAPMYSESIADKYREAG